MSNVAALQSRTTATALALFLCAVLVWWISSRFGATSAGPLRTDSISPVAPSHVHGQETKGSSSATREVMAVEKPPTRSALIVKDKAGNPIVQASVFFHQHAAQRFIIACEDDIVHRVDENGMAHFDFPVDDSGYVVASVSAPGFVSTSTSIDGPGTWSLTMKPGATQLICVRDPDGNPIADARVALSATTFDSQAGLVWANPSAVSFAGESCPLWVRKTDRNGEVVFDNVPEGILRYKIEHPDFIWIGDNADGKELIVPSAARIVRVRAIVAACLTFSGLSDRRVLDLRMEPPGSVHVVNTPTTCTGTILAKNTLRNRSGFEAAHVKAWAIESATDDKNESESQASFEALLDDGTVVAGQCRCDRPSQIQEPDLVPVPPLDTDTKAVSLTFLAPGGIPCPNEAFLIVRRWPDSNRIVSQKLTSGRPLRLAPGEYKIYGRDLCYGIVEDHVIVVGEESAQAIAVPVLRPVRMCRVTMGPDGSALIGNGFLTLVSGDRQMHRGLMTAQPFEFATPTGQLQVGFDGLGLRRFQQVFSISNAEPNDDEEFVIELPIQELLK